MHMVIHDYSHKLSTVQPSPCNIIPTMSLQVAKVTNFHWSQFFFFTCNYFKHIPTICAAPTYDWQLCKISSGSIERPGRSLTAIGKIGSSTLPQTPRQKPVLKVGGKKMSLITTHTIINIAEINKRKTDEQRHLLSAMSSWASFVTAHLWNHCNIIKCL